MPSLEELARRLLRAPQAGERLALGALFLFFPVVHCLAFGYLWRFAQQVRTQGDLSLPAWDDWYGLFVDGLRLTLLVLVFGGIPLLAGYGISWLLLFPLEAIGLPLFAYAPVALVVPFVPLLTSAALFQWQRRGEWKDCLDVGAIWLLVYSGGTSFGVAGLVFVGLLTVGLPLYGAAIFLGFLLVFAHTQAVWGSRLQSSSRRA